MSTTADSVAVPGKRGPTEARTSGGGAFARPPALARDVELLGRFAKSGHRRPPSLIRRADGQIIQLTPLLYEVVGQIDGRRGYAEIAQAVGARVGKVITDDDIRVLTESKLQPLGLVRGADGAEPVTKKANPLLALRLRMVVTNPRITGRIAALFSWLFAPPIVLAFALAFATTTGWLLFDRGLAAATRHALYEPGLLLLIFALTTLSAGFHELGHAAACRYSGGDPGAMGVGLYLVWPAFYTDVTDAYRLDRRARLRVDLGGMYFNAIFGMAAFALWTVTGWEALLVLIALQALQMLRQLVPLVRLDGYHILADLTGVPDLFAHIKPILRNLVPTRRRRAHAIALKPWVRVVVTAWVLIVVPLLTFIFVVLTLTLPRLAATAWDSLGRRWASLQSNVAEGHLTGAGTEMLAVLALAVPVLSVTYLIARVVLRTSRRVWRATEGHPVRRGIALLVAVGMLAGLLFAWWPHGQYRPIQEDDRGTLLEFSDGPPPMDGVASRGAEPPATLLAYEDQQTLEYAAVSADIGVAAYALAQSDSTQADGSALTEQSSPEFMFPLPAPPGEGDNQALAINMEDGATLIDLALALVFAGDELVDNSNEAYALASCMDCVTVAIAFQTVVILNEDPDVVPENLAVAINADCATCLTYAAASQLIVNLIEPLSDAEMDELNAVWKKLKRLKARAHRLSLDRLFARLAALQEKIAAVFESEDGDAESELHEASATSIDTESTSISASPSPSATPTPTPSPSPTSSPSPSPTSSPSPSPTSSPSPSPSSSPSPSPS